MNTRRWWSRRRPLRNVTVAVIVLIVLTTLVAGTASAGVGGGCIRTYARGWGEGTYLYSSTNGAIGVGFETNAVGGGAAVFVVIQPSNCGNIEPPDPEGLGGSKGFEPIGVPALVLP